MGRPQGKHRITAKTVPAGAPAKPKARRTARPTRFPGGSRAADKPQKNWFAADGVTRLLCRHCNKNKANRPRQMCWSCYYTPGVKELYTSRSKYARRGIGLQAGGLPLDTRTCRGRRARWRL